MQFYGPIIPTLLNRLIIFAHLLLAATSLAATPINPPHPESTEGIAVDSYSLPIDKKTRTRLAQVLAEKQRSEPEYRPRTEHLNTDGSPRFTNRLIIESSPYLQQHAHNPVNWYSWNEEALQTAKRENKPIFLSIGYSTCHWCHVMERESFENLTIAKQLNEHFISIKVDREQRPDLDDIYMAASNVISGHGGWPLTAFLTPEGKPFFAATYFPPQRFSQLLNEVQQHWHTDPDTLISSAQRVHTTIATLMAPQSEGELPNQSLIDQTVQHYLNNFDEFNGGFGTAPKFPQETVLFLLLNQAVQQRDSALLGTVIQTLDAMQQGGIHDQVGGGFHRYATDPEWLVPHFEKMLYNQAQLGELYLKTWQLTNNPLYRRTLEHTLDYVLKEMTTSHGAFFSATDADSEGEEGRFFIWSQEELKDVLSEQDYLLVEKLFGVTEGGNFEGSNILHLPHALPDFAIENLLPSQHFLAQLDQIRERLYKVRAQRIKPGLDDKVVTAWNGMMIRTLALSGHQLRHPRYLAAAWQAGEHLWQQQRTNEGLLWRDTRRKAKGAPGTQEDYAYLARAYLTLYDTSGDPLWLQRAQQLTDQMLELFWDENQGGLFLSNSDSLTPLRTRSLDDGATPSGNAIAFAPLRELAARTGDQRYEHKAKELVQRLAGAIDQSPLRFSYLLSQYAEQMAGRFDPLQYGAAGALKAEVVALEEGFRLKIQLAEGWHINAQKPGDKRLIGAKVYGKYVERIQFPTASPLPVNFSEQPIAVYSGQFSVTGRLQSSGEIAGEELPPRLHFRFQACSDRTCLPPEELVMQIPAVH